MQVRDGHAEPLGATPVGHGVNFALAAHRASRVELCLFDDSGGETRVDMPARSGGVWHALVEGVGPGSRYGFRLHGPPRDPRDFPLDATKLVADPYARALSGDFHCEPCVFEGAETDSAPHVPKSVVVDGRFDWGADPRPAVPWGDTVIYECHVRGMTLEHPEVAEAARGRYLGLIAEPVLAHLSALGVTTVELMPVQHFVDEARLAPLGLSNYWGYNPLGFFAPHAGYASGDRGQQVSEFKSLVRGMHRAGLEVLLDVVFNHTAEGGAEGPILCWKALDRRSYYRWTSHEPARLVNHSGCGNTWNISSQLARETVLDCLRYWATEMQVDGFRFDLAPVLGRDRGTFDPDGSFFRALASDPVLSQLKLIAEPWDLGPGGYRLGGFPRPWREWNGRFRDTVRAFWRGDDRQAADLATRLAGSADLFGGRGPWASINFVSSHDGFTLEDLVSYERKHNAANGEEGRDGEAHNLSRNWGVEGPSDDPTVRELRARIKRGLMATLALAQGVPMIRHGDELGHSQGGNNNAYCQDSAISWLDWSLDAEQREFLAFLRRLFALRSRHELLRRPLHAPAFGEGRWLRWLHPDGGWIEGDRWDDPDLTALGALLLAEPVAEATPAAPGSLLILINGGGEARSFPTPDASSGARWTWLLDSERGDGGAVGGSPGARTVVGAHTVLVLLCEAVP
jgi:glycogen operon protein